MSTISCWTPCRVDGRVERLAQLDGQAPAHVVGPEKAWFATVAKPSSSVRSASSRWAMRSPVGSRGSFTRTQKQCTRTRRSRRAGPGFRTSNAPAGPTSHVPSSPRSGTRPVRWQVARRGPRGRRAARAPPRWPAPRRGRGLGRTTLAPRWAYSSGMIQARATQASATGSDRGSSASRSAAVPRNGTTCATVVRSRSRRAARAARRRRAGASGRARARGAARRPRPRPAGQPLGDRQAQDHELGADGQPPHLLGLPGACRDHPEVAAIELGAEGRDRRLDRLGPSAVHCASVAWPLWSMRISPDMGGWYVTPRGARAPSA